MNKRIYLDHAAATPLDPKVHKAMEPFWALDFGNPSAIHKEGVAARLAVSYARTAIAKVLGVNDDTIIFTAGATESCNLALIGSVRAWQKAHTHQTPEIIVSAIEHDAVLAPAEALKKEGVLVHRIPVDAEGIIDLAVLKSLITKNTVLISIMHANNEIGTISPLEDAAKLIRKWKKEERGVTRDEAQEGDARYPLLHSDAAQSGNFLPLNAPKLGVDLLTISSPKIYGPKGVGLLFIARTTPIDPLIVGGGQERALRAGTENVPLIVGFAEALVIAQDMASGEAARLTTLRDHYIKELLTLKGLVINGSLKTRLPNNIHFSLPAVDHEFLCLALDARGFAVATKSACNETDTEISHVLLALREGSDDKRPVSGIRISLGRENTEADLPFFMEALRDILSTMIICEDDK